MMKDMIDKRNERERIARSIIKYWNVNYIPRTQADSGMQKQTAEAENAQDQKWGSRVTISCYSAYDITRKMAEESRCLRSYFANTMELAMII